MGVEKKGGGNLYPHLFSKAGAHSAYTLTVGHLLLAHCRGANLAEWLVPAILIPVAALLADAVLTWKRSKMGKEAKESFKSMPTYRRSDPGAAATASLKATGGAAGKGMGGAGGATVAPGKQQEGWRVVDNAVFVVSGEPSMTASGVTLHGASAPGSVSNGTPRPTGLHTSPSVPRLAPGQILSVEMVLEHQKNMKNGQAFSQSSSPRH